MPWRSTSSAIEASRHDFMRPKLWMVMLFLGVLVAHGLPFHHHVLSSDLYLPLHAAMASAGGVPPLWF